MHLCFVVLFIDESHKSSSPKALQSQVCYITVNGTEADSYTPFYVFKHSWIPQTGSTLFRNLYDCVPHLSLTCTEVNPASVASCSDTQHTLHMYTFSTHTHEVLRPITCVFQNWFDSVHAWLGKHKKKKKDVPGTWRFIGCTDNVCIAV